MIKPQNRWAQKNGPLAVGSAMPDHQAHLADFYHALPFITAPIKFQIPKAEYDL